MDKSLATHFMFENTHPFKDGNGRTGRYLLSSYLSKKLDSFTGLTISTSIHNHVQKYYQLFRDAGNIENRGDLTNFIDGMLDIIIDGQQSVITQMQSRKSKLDENMKHIQKLYPTLNDDYNSILYIFLQSKLFTDGKKNGIQDRQLAEIAKNSRNISRRAFKTIIDDLTDKKIITLVSSNPLQHVLSDNCIN
nr:Fic family protein [Lacticaseibacillus sharpeae]